MLKDPVDGVIREGLTEITFNVRPEMKSHTFLSIDMNIPSRKDDDKCRSNGENNFDMCSYEDHGAQ